MAGLYRRQLYYMLYKNFKNKLRNKRQTLVEIIVVLYFVGILAIIKVTSKQDLMPAIKENELMSFNVQDLLNGRRQTTVGYVLNPPTSPLLKNLITEIESNSNFNFYAFSTESELDDSYQNNDKNITIGLLLNFNSTQNGLDYVIKTPKDKITSLDETTTTPDKCRSGVNNIFIGKNMCPATTYIATGFAEIQTIIDLKFIQLVTNQPSPLNISSSLKMFPKYDYQPSTSYLRTVISIYMNIAFAPYIMFLLTYIVTEKEQKIKESMKIMGLNMTAYWLSWFITYVCVIFIGCVITVIISTAVDLYGDSNFFIIFLFLFFYGWSIITLAFMMTVFFNKAKTAGFAGSLATVVISLLSLLHVYVDTSTEVKWLTCLLSPVALSLGLTSGLASNEALTFSNFTSHGDFPPLYVILMLLFDTFLYLILAIYLDAIHPGEYGKARHPCFIFSPTFWRSVFGKKTQDDGMRRSSLLRSPSHEGEDSLGEDVEDIPEELLGDKVIRIHNLHKHFKQGKKKPDLKALDGVSLDVYEGQITALLGHNGAGKSTLISTLTGMITSSKGNAEMYGFNINNAEEMDNIRQLIGLCPQQNVIFDALNAREHLIVYAGIKGIPTDIAKQAVEELLVEIDLADHATTIAKSLSGGQKRKLCVGMALIGNPKIVFLDEPTSGMDPSSRRKIWSLLQSKRSNRVIFLTTHFMDEADILADYKAIMSKGKIRCAGSSLFLKNRFGIGYHLGMTVNETADVARIKQVVTEQVSGAEVSRQHGKELAFRLPLTQVKTFPDLFKSFETLNDGNDIFAVPTLGIVSYGVSMTTLEEVFLKLEEQEEEQQEEDKEVELEKVTETTDQYLNISDQNNLSESTVNLHPTPVNIENVRPEKREISLWIQLMALLEVRVLMSYRSVGKTVWIVIIPSVLLIIGLILFRNTAKANTKTSETLHLKPSLYLKTISNNAGNELIWKLHDKAKTDYASVKQALDDIGVINQNVSNLDLLKLGESTPHSIAYDIKDITSVMQLNHEVRYNDTQTHSLPVAINTISNAMASMIASKTGTSFHNKALPISTSNKPFKTRKPEWLYDASGQTAGLLIGLCFTQMAGGFGVEPVQTRELGIRHQLRVSGTNRLIYWLSFLLLDLAFYILPIIVLYILIPAMNIKALNIGAALGTLFLVLIFYIPGSVLFAYVLGFMFNKMQTAQNVIPTIFNIFAMAPYFIISIMDMVSGDINNNYGSIAVALAFVDPPCAFMLAIYYIGRVYRVESILTQDENIVPESSKYFEMISSNAIPGILLVLVVHLFLFTWLLFALDNYKAGGNLIFPLSYLKKLKLRFRRNRSVSRSSSHKTTQSNVNDDVRREKEKVVNCVFEDKMNEKALLIEGLEKKFKDKKVVRDMNMTVERGEIFGILGPNGAGKTTTLNMVTSDLHPNKGQIFIDGFNVDTDLASALQSLGYCPQIDALWEIVTIKEHLKCYALIKGVQPDEIDRLITHYGTSLKITEHLDKKAKELSGGTKRKLSFLMSMIGNANIIMMDEPSCGMDPGARRFLWTAISSNIQGDRSVVLTTHSMEEADALCERVGIMVKGELKCVGTTQELKTTYGAGYQLEIKFKMNPTEQHKDRKAIVGAFISSLFPDVIELEYFGSRITYKIPIDNVKNLSYVFSRLEQGKVDVNIEEYSFSQSTLEQVFLEFAKEQDEDFTGQVNPSLEI